MPFVTELVVRESAPGQWELLAPLEYEGRADRFTVPAGTVTDLASVPRWLTWLVPVAGRWTKAAVLHDHLWDARAVSYADADGVFRRVLRELGVPLLRRWLMWAAVRAVSLLRYERRLGAVPAVAAVALPGALFVAVPALVVLAFLLVYWLVEGAVGLVLRDPARRVVLPR